MRANGMKMSDTPMVSVICATYNHQEYIEDALQGFITQVTDFPFEVIVHDDASTDKTPEIMKKYEIDYPHIFRMIYQQQNQHSQGKRIVKDIMLPIAKGKYFAFCEGDDYWIDPRKLQKQYDHMEADPDCTLCIHNAYNIRGTNKDRYTGKVTVSKRSRIISTEEVIRGGGGFCATNSIFAPIKLARALPAYFDYLSMDLVWQMYLASCGTTFCFSDYMSVYRQGVIGSWTDRMREDNQKKDEHVKRVEEFHQRFDEETGYFYHDTILYKTSINRINMLIRNGEYDRIIEADYSVIKKHLSARQRVHYFLVMHYPKMFGFIRQSKRLIAKKFRSVAKG